MVTKKFSDEITMKRPMYRGFREIAEKIKALDGMDDEEAIESPHLEAVLRACTVEDIGPWLEQAVFNQPLELFDAIREFCEFDAFFAERQTRQLKRFEANMRHQAAMTRAMRESGMLPDGFSMVDALALEDALNLTQKPSSSPTTQDSAGRGKKSNKKTSGSSSATSPSQSGDLTLSTN